MSTPTVGSRTAVIRALGWMGLGRGLGLAWTLLVIGRLGIADYGRYGTAYAVCAIVANSLDHPFAIRAVREPEVRFLSERTARVTTGMVLIVLAALGTGAGYVIWFGLALAGSELIVGACKSRALRDGRPARVWQIDTLRQTASVTLAGTFLLLADQPDLVRASLLYLAPYAVILMLMLPSIRWYRPSQPGPWRQIGVLVAEMFATTLYLQGDLVLLGHLADETVVGYYAVTQTVFFALIAVPQAYMVTFHEPLRASGGDPRSGPSIPGIAGASTLPAAGLLLAGAAVLVAGGPRSLAVSLGVMAMFGAARAATICRTAVLVAQRRDGLRFGAVAALIPVKLALLWSAVEVLGLDRTGAPLTAGVIEIILLRLLWVGSRSPRDTTPTFPGVAAR